MACPRKKASRGYVRLQRVLRSRRRELLGTTLRALESGETHMSSVVKQHFCQVTSWHGLEGPPDLLIERNVHSPPT